MTHQDSYNRRTFILSGAVGATLLGAGSGASMASQSGQFDVGLFQQIANAKNSRRKHMFSSTTISGGIVLTAIGRTIEGYRRYDPTTTSDLALVAVLYRSMAVALAFNDAVWNELIIPSASSLPADAAADIGQLKAGTGNPFGKTASPGIQGQSISSLSAIGCHFLVCEDAVSGLARILSQVSGSSFESIRLVMTNGLMPACILVPSGIWAMQALQERHFSLVQVTL